MDPRSEDRGEASLETILCEIDISSVPRNHCKVYDIDAVLDSTNIDKDREHGFAL